jgi:uncharacterized protein (TIGR03067 family)
MGGDSSAAVKRGFRPGLCATFCKSDRHCTPGIHARSAVGGTIDNDEIAMKTLLPTLLLGLMTVIISGARAEENEAVKKDIALLQGEWTMVSGSANGQSMPDEMVKQMKRVCKGDETTTTMGGQTFMKAKITIDPSKNPKTIDYEMTEGFTKGKKQLGIYEVNGDIFKSCFGKPDGERPTDFTSTPSDGRTFSVWKRAQPAGPSQPKSQQ